MAHFMCYALENVPWYVGVVLELRKLDFRGVKGQINVKKSDFTVLIAKIDYLRPILTSTAHLWPIFMLLCHGNYALRYVGVVLELRKFDFRGFKGQINVKKADFRVLIAKIRYLRPILASTTHIWIMP